MVNASKYMEGFKFAQVYSESEVDFWDIAYLSSLSPNIELDTQWPPMDMNGITHSNFVKYDCSYHQVGA